MRDRIFEIVGVARDGDYASRAYDIFIVVIALLSIVPLLFNPTRISPFTSFVITAVDMVTVYILIMDYFFRWMTHDLKTGKGWKAFVLYPITPMAIIDLLAILPSLGVLPSAFAFLRVLRVVKVFRYSRNLVIVTNACAREAKTLFSVFCAVVVYMFTVALIVYTSEPEAFVNYFDSVCWVATQMTSVTFSDSRPTKYLGQALSIASALVALLVVALPAGVITGAYINELRESKRDSIEYFKSVSPVKRRLRDYDKPSVWLKKNLKIVRYIVIMTLSLLASLTSYGLFCLLGLDGSVVFLGVALATFLLEPAAGLVVGLISCAVGAFLAGDPSYAFYMTQYGMTVVAFGFVLPRLGERHFALRIVATVLILVVGCGLLDCVIAFARAGYSPSGAYAIQLQEIPMISLFENASLTPWAAAVTGTLAAYVVSTICVAVVFVLLVFLFGVRAAPSEAERHQQQAILLERALKKKEMESLEARKLTKETLSAELRRLTEQQKMQQEQIALVEKRLREIEAAEAAEDVEATESEGA